MERTLAARKRESRFHGLLIVDKPGDPAPGAPHSLGGAPTSHNVVQMARRWSGQRRIGHTGTLDPMASGVLVLCLGHATRLVEYYQRHDKQYYAEMALGGYRHLRRDWRSRRTGSAPCSTAAAWTKSRPVPRRYPADAAGLFRHQQQAKRCTAPRRSGGDRTAAPHPPPRSADCAGSPPCLRVRSAPTSAAWPTISASPRLYAHLTPAPRSRRRLQLSGRRYVRRGRCGSGAGACCAPPGDGLDPPTLRLDGARSRGSATVRSSPCLRRRTRHVCAPATS